MGEWAILKLNLLPPTLLHLLGIIKDNLIEIMKMFLPILAFFVSALFFCTLCWPLRGIWQCVTLNMSTQLQDITKNQENIHLS